MTKPAEGRTIRAGFRVCDEGKRVQVWQISVATVASRCSPPSRDPALLAAGRFEPRLPPWSAALLCSGQVTGAAAGSKPGTVSGPPGWMAGGEGGSGGGT